MATDSNDGIALERKIFSKITFGRDYNVQEVEVPITSVTFQNKKSIIHFLFWTKRQHYNVNQRTRNLPYRPVSSLRSPRTISCRSMWVASSMPFTNSSNTGPDVGTERFASICARNCNRDSLMAWSSPWNSWIRARFKRRKPATEIWIHNNANRQ